MDILSSSLLSSGALGTTLTLVIVYAISYFLRRKNTMKHIPLLKDTSHDLREAIAKGYKMESMFKVPALHDDVVVLPMRFLDEIKSLPEDKVSFSSEVHHRFVGGYTGADLHPLLIKVVKVDLTRNVAAGIDAIQDELIYAVNRIIGPCEEWTPINIYSSLLKTIALLSGRVFVGLPLSRDDTWIKVTVECTINVFLSATALLRYPAWIRPLVAPFLPEYRTLQKMRSEASRLLKPILRARLEEMKQPGYVKKKDLIEWAIESSGPEAKNLDEQAQLQLTASMAAIHTTTMAISHFLYDLVSRPEYFEPLREELKMVLEQDGGVFVKTSMTKLRKLDSFIKESQRLNPPDLLSLQRRVISDFQLSDGTQLKKNMSIAFPAHEVNRDSSKWANPNEFNGFRFDNLRKEPGSENKYQFVTTSSDSFNFGHGTHACPGRFFASNEMKVLLAYLILNYDIKLKEGTTARPDNIYHDSTVAPNREIDLLFRKRVVS